jgi:hypothetical protein
LQEKVVGGLFGENAASIFTVEAGGSRFTFYAEDHYRNTVLFRQKEGIRLIYV